MRCHQLGENPRVQVSGLWVLTSTGMRRPLEKPVVANISLAGSLFTPVLLRDVFSTCPAVASEIFWGLEEVSYPSQGGVAAPAAPAAARTLAWFVVGSRCGGLGAGGLT